LVQLQTLDISENHFQSLPAGIANMVSLSKLFLDFNPFKPVPPVLSDMKHAKWIQTSHTVGMYLTDWIKLAKAGGKR